VKVKSPPATLLPEGRFPDDSPSRDSPADSGCAFGSFGPALVRRISARFDLDLLWRRRHKPEPHIQIAPAHSVAAGEAGPSRLVLFEAKDFFIQVEWGSSLRQSKNLMCAMDIVPEVALS
jgi:hypothetical protein